MWWLLLACPAPSDTDAGDSDCTPIVWHADVDADGFGSPLDTTEACTQPAGHVPSGDDCDDLDEDVHPGAPETCDGVDQDCDGTPDEGLTSFADTDGDGFGDAAVLVDCTAGTADATDCDDTRSDVYPGADEICDGVDQDCDGAKDEDPVDGPWWYPDGDGDGWGISAGAAQACTGPSGTASGSGDCDDADPAVSPGATEICENGVDEDCDGADDCRISGTWDGSRAGARILGETELEGMLWAGGFEIGASPGLFVASSGNVWIFYEAPTTDVYVSEANGMLTPPSGSGWALVEATGTDLGTDGVEDLLLYDRPNDVLYVVSADSSGDAVSSADTWLVNSSDGWLEPDPGPADMDGDGFSDLWVGTPGATTSTAFAGAAYLLAGPSSGALSLADATATIVSNVESTFGQAVVSADLDGDGSPELVVAAPQYTEGGSDGAVFVFREVGGTLDAADADAIIVGGVGYPELGTDLCAADDLDGDGVEDLLVASYDSFWVVLRGLSTSGDVGAAVYATFDPSGATIAPTATPDLDGDGAADLVLTAHAEATYLYYGPVPSGTFAHGDGADAAVGGDFDYLIGATSPGDVDSDGYDDLLLIDHDSSVGARYSGATYLFLGSGL